MDLLLATFLGLISGILIGLLPGLGTTTFILICSPFLLNQSFLFCILFYCVMSSTSQYFGNVTTLSFGVPGENTSIPLFSIRDKILKNNKVNEVYFLCASGSFIASILTGIIIYYTVNLYTNIFYLKSYFSFLCAILGIILCLFCSSNKFYISFFLMIFGWTLGKIGYDDIYNQSFLTFDNPYLYSGLPSLPVLIGVYAIPSLFKMITENKKLIDQISYSKLDFNKIKCLYENIGVIFRSSIVGFISGLIPYVGNSVSSFLAFALEQKINPKNYISQAIASESANNSANLSVLIPLLFLGVAIIPSEFVLLEILMTSNKIISWETLSKNYLSLVVFLFLANAISFYISWNSIKIINMLMSKFKIILPFLLLLLIIVMILHFGISYSQGTYYIFVLLIFSILGFILQKYDILPFVYAFLLQNNIEQSIYRVYTIYFGGFSWVN